jgi:nucleoporin NUP42
VTPSSTNSSEISPPLVLLDPITHSYSENTIELELKTERPQWIMSSFGTAKYEPCLFFGYEMSQEEMRWKSVQALRAGQPQQYVSRLTSLNVM